MEDFEFGDILNGQHTIHPIIFFSVVNEEQFYGCIVTHAVNYKNNFALEKEHFLENNVDGEKFPLQYDNSYCAKLKLEKKVQWGPYQKVGQLSNDGIEFIKARLENEQPTNWNRYLRAIKRERKRIK